MTSLGGGTKPNSFKKTCEVFVKWNAKNKEETDSKITITEK
jgi:hypothetical protein